MFYIQSHSIKLIFPLNYTGKFKKNEYPNEGGSVNKAAEDIYSQKVMSTHFKSLTLMMSHYTKDSN